MEPKADREEYPSTIQGKADSSKTSLSPFEIATFILSIYVLSALLAETAIPLSAESRRLLGKIDYWVCFVFLAEFFYNLYTAPCKRAFLRWGWIDLISSIPMADTFRIGRLARVIRVVRLLRAIRSSKHMMGFLLRKQRSTSLLSVLTLSLVLMVSGAIAVLQFETTNNSNIQSPADALWWAFTTITTVGYGDKYPVTQEGRFVAAILMTVGVGVFGTFTGFMASLFVDPELKQEEVEIQHLTKAIQSLSKQIDALESRLLTDQDTQHSFKPKP